jgi:hypothetical protein
MTQADEIIAGAQRDGKRESTPHESVATSPKSPSPIADVRRWPPTAALRHTCQRRMLTFDEVIQIISLKLSELGRARRMNEYAKWAWFFATISSVFGEVP